MNRKWKLALAALLGFSTACSTVKNAPRRDAAEGGERIEQRDSLRIMVMYGVPTPRPERLDAQQQQQQQQQREASEVADPAVGERAGER
ncbi:hypothetical protein [uncultured Alistipes sp.]|uniref:hypothetical protein n=1 Tax=uncultured Alistipes sp. TaxID=538949 RepID=UPI0026293061|nr:hypothetical protein [uncultured Alistipes sp.]